MAEPTAVSLPPISSLFGGQPEDSMPAPGPRSAILPAGPARQLPPPAPLARTVQPAVDRQTTETNDDDVSFQEPGHALVYRGLCTSGFDTASAQQEMARLFGADVVRVARRG